MTEDRRLWPSEGFVFIVSYGRTGSTLLQTVLQSIPGYFIRGENWNTLYPLFRSHVLASHARIHQGSKEIPPHGPWYGADQIDLDRYGLALADLFIREILQPPAGQRVIGFKEIRFGLAQGDEFNHFLDFIARFFKPARFIFNTRNPEEVAVSSWWKDIERSQALQKIADVEARFRGYIESHPETCMHVPYESFNGNPEGLRPMFNFLGEEFDLSVVERLMERRLKH
ncbi:sulfotransferase [Pseudokordiimonas caeni]|uniref:sulfotransferase n=1 Tax=Pseudokordiimonas caeni TaxID=2997908 RepID=UPI0028122A07|nr:sulfotransferase [Pseudokordiimonas caeni]